MSDLSRRAFTAATVGAAVSASSSAQVAGANDRLRVGIIGCGGIAGHHLKTLLSMKETDNVVITAVCDIYDKRREEFAGQTGARQVKDYRDLLSSKDVDYVLIATPEHWHYQMAVDAAEAGKHVYLEKPMTHTIEESKKLVARLRGAPIKLQVGVQGMSDESYEVANQYVKDGTLGKVVLAQIDYSRNHKGDFWADPSYKIDPDAEPGVNLDWKAWLGPAPKRPWDPERYFRWRRYWDYSGGIATDLFVHRATRLIKALGLTFPERVVAAGGKFAFTDSKAEIPDTMNVLLDYPGGPTMQLVSSMANSHPVDHLLRGHKATLQFTRTGFTIKPEREYEGEVQPVSYEKKGSESTLLHHRNLQNAIRKGEALKCDMMLGYYGVVACDMGVQSLRKRQYLAWDADKQRVVQA